MTIFVYLFSTATTQSHLSGITKQDGTIPPFFSSLDNKPDSLFVLLSSLQAYYSPVT